MSERTYTKHEVDAILERRRWKPEMIRQFYAVYGSRDGYTMDMIDRMEYAVNASVYDELHPKMVNHL